MQVRKLYPALWLIAGIGIGALLTKPWTRETSPPSSNSPTVPVKAISDRPLHSESSAAQSSGSDSGTQLANALANPDRDARGEALRKLARDLAGSDIAAALDLGARISDEGDRIDFTRALFAAWAARDPRAAAGYAKERMSAGLLQSEAIGAVLEKWGGGDPRSAYQWADANLSGPLKEEGLTSLIQGWSRVDSSAAAAWFVATGSTSQPTLNALITTWADLNPREAAAWVETLSDPANRATARLALVSEWARQNPEAATEHAKPWLTGPDGVDLVTTLVGSWGAGNPAAAAEWIEKLPAGNLRNEAAANLATTWAASDIESAVRWAEKISDAEMKAGVINHLGTTWGAIEPEKALAWLEKLPPDEVRWEATIGALNSWAATDSAAMEEWIRNQPPGERTDSARQSLGEVEIDRNPAKAMEIALATNDRALRNDSTVKYFRQWSRKDPSGAAAWLQSAKLTSDLRERLAGIRR